MYRAALRLKPSSLTARTALADLMLAERRYAEAEVEARAALALNFEVARAHFDLWAALEAQGRWAALVTALQRFLAARPDHAEAGARLTRALALSGERPPSAPQPAAG